MIFKRTRDTQRGSYPALRAIADAVKDAIIMMDHNGAISFWNPAAQSILGYRADEALGKELHALLAPQQYYEAYRTGLAHFRQTGRGATIGRTLELTARRKNGTEFPIELSLSALFLEGQWHAVGIVRDISERKTAEEELRAHRVNLERLVAERAEELTAVNESLRREIEDRTRTEQELFRSESFLNTIFDSFHDPLSIVDRDFRIVKFNDAFARMRGKRASDLFGRRCHETLQASDCICADCIVNTTFQSRDPCAKEKLIALPDGSRLWCEIYTYPIFDGARNVTHVIEYSRDITDRKKEEKEKTQLIRNLNRLSTTDVLTGLLNRRALNDLLEHEIERASRYGTGLSMILCDIDRFKAINDGYGHTAGDRALQAVADTLRGVLRKADYLGRYGGDEFMIILPETAPEGAKSLAEKVRSAVGGRELELPGGERVRLSLSIGVGGCSAGDDIDSFVARVDGALYASKEGGRDRVSVAGP